MKVYGNSKNETSLQLTVLYIFIYFDHLTEKH